MIRQDQLTVPLDPPGFKGGSWRPIVGKTEGEYSQAQRKQIGHWEAGEINSHGYPGNGTLGPS